ncbi:hypothetical protein D1AOALGA4SA_3780 [Olavius algarvensis Delta 1 endosymbiont]|nr:hypothetical protein D1AOALGA4SA_3780 [Olavius algarvensis Delta 1 endosymbiont]
MIFDNTSKAYKYRVRRDEVCRENPGKNLSFILNNYLRLWEV